MNNSHKKLHFYKFIISYDGSCFAGSAKQPDAIGMQNVLDAALAKVGARAILGANKAISQLASRTDKGVHALVNVAKVGFLYEINPSFVINKINSTCSGIFIKSITKCSEDFQPRFDAKYRSYRYIFATDFKTIEHVNLLNYDDLKIIQCAKSPLNAFNGSYFTPWPKGAKLEKFIKAARALNGEHDFKHLCLNASEHESTIRKIFNTRLYMHKQFLVFNIHSSGFLRGQIRLIMGALLATASSKISQEQWLEQLSSKQAHHRLSASASGLYLKSISY